MRKAYLTTIFLFLSQLIGVENLYEKSIVTNPFFKKETPNFCLNNFSSYPIGIFNTNQSLKEYTVNLDISSNLIAISEST